VVVTAGTLQLAGKEHASACAEGEGESWQWKPNVEIFCRNRPGWMGRMGEKQGEEGSAARFEGNVHG